eukprot:comp20695_c0_seq3/m.42424 comp20695_c0_seq3/g.42424  ORF comp20695_c0_seq3/g.42424 comp20695_c0_seq3/m.42424 type:complete len:304 (+) comp20695_c0_seq3:710-1621(+)
MLCSVSRSFSSCARVSRSAARRSSSFLISAASCALSAAPAAALSRSCCMLSRNTSSYERASAACFSSAALRDLTFSISRSVSRTVAASSSSLAARPWILLAWATCLVSILSISPRRSSSCLRLASLRTACSRARRSCWAAVEEISSSSLTFADSAPSTSCCSRCSTDWVRVVSWVQCRPPSPSLWPSDSSLSERSGSTSRSCWTISALISIFGGASGRGCSTATGGSSATTGGSSATAGGSSATTSGSSATTSGSSATAVGSSAMIGGCSTCCCCCADSEIGSSSSDDDESAIVYEEMSAAGC